MAREPIASIMDKMHSQLDEAELRAEIDIELPDTLDEQLTSP